MLSTQAVFDIYNKRSDTRAANARDANTPRAKARVAFRDECLPTVKEKPILEYALRAPDSERITVAQHLEQLSDVDPAAAPPMRCPVCGERVHLARMHDRAHTPHFVHTAGVRALCPLVNVTLPITTAFLNIYPYNTRLGYQRRREFAQHWRHHLAEIRRHAPNFSVVRLTHSLAQADVLQMWSCPTLALQDVPYILLVLSTFIAQTPGLAHPTWLRFLFDTSVKEVGDLRRPDRFAPRFFRLHYRPAHNSMFPDASHLLDWSEVAMSGAFLQADCSNVMMSEAATFSEFMNSEAQPENDAVENRLGAVPIRKSRMNK
jgi:hypothetical protein